MPEACCPNNLARSFCVILFVFMIPSKRPFDAAFQKTFLLLLLLTTAGIFSRSQAQTNTEVFGQNRVQRRTFEWKFFDTEHFRIYHYDRSGRSLARYVAEQAESDISVVEKKLEGRFPKRFNIILYNQYDDYRQTNTGLRWESQLRDVPTGTVNLVGDQLVVYFTGVHTDLQRQLRLGMGRAVMERMLFGESAREMVRNYVNLNLPPWVIEGFITYLTDGWNSEANAKWKALTAAQRKPNFYLLAEANPALAGKAFWKWVADTRGLQEVRTLLYLMRTRGSANGGIKAVLGMKERRAEDSCLAYFRRQYTADSTTQQAPEKAAQIALIKRPKDGGVIRDIRVSPSGRDVAYTRWNHGVFEVILQRNSGQATSFTILSTGQSDYNELSPDPDYPLLCWSNDGFNIAILYKRNGKTRLKLYNSFKNRTQDLKIPDNRFDRVLGMSFIEDNTKLVFSAIKKSQTDLYEFRIKNTRLTNITDDVWDDIQPSYASGGFRKGLLFLSNRPAPHKSVPAEVNVLPTGPMNAFFYNTVTQSPDLIQLSHSQNTGGVIQPIQFGTDHFAYLDDSNGVRNQYVVIDGRDVRNMDSAYGIPATNLPQSILYQQYTLASNRVSYALERADGFAVYQQDIKIPGTDTPRLPFLPLTRLQQKEEELRAANVVLQRTATRAKTARQERAERRKAQKKIYQSEFEQDTTSTFITTASGRKIDTNALLNPFNKDSTYLKLKAQPYRLSFKPDFVSARFDNTVLFTRYQNVATNGVGFTPPPLGGLVTISLHDALENHRFTGGVRIPTNLKGGTYFLQYENFTRRWDWSLLAYRDGNVFQTPVGFYDRSGRLVFARDEVSRNVTYLFQGTASYPFDRVRRISLTGGARFDRVDWKAQDSISLGYLPDQRSNWAISRAEYVYDNSIMPALNVRRGIRAKVYAEGLMGLSETNKGSMYNIGFDFRLYQKLYRTLTLATRLAGAHSGGKQKVLYFLGGVDNWLNARNATGVGIGQESYAFQALVTNLRGYDRMARNGNSYAVLNEELRLPVWNTLVKRPTKSALLQTLQLVAFTDVGAAWNGLFPTGNNMSRPIVVQSPGNPVSLMIEDPNSSGVAVGYGLGMRTTLLGYFVRLDAAWNIEGIRKPLWYLSFGTDF